MKKRILTGAAALLTALALIPVPSSLAVVAGNTVYTNRRQVADNLEYINTIEWSAGKGRMESFALQLSGTGDVYPVVMKGDTIFGKFTISSMINYAESLGKNVVAAINSDFFSTQTGVPFGIVIEDGVYKSSSGYEPGICFMQDGGVYFANDAHVDITLLNNGGGGDNAGKTVKLLNFNKYRTDTGGMYMYSSDFSTVSTRTSSNGWFVRFRILEGMPTVSGEMLLEVTETLTADGAVPIGDGYLVLTAATSGGYIEEFEKFAPGDIVTMTTTCRDPYLAGARHATGGGDRLIANGAITDPAAWDKDIRNLIAPRTAIGVKADGTVLFYVLDGRNAEHSVGKTLADLAQYMLELGCVSAVNLDGGGSSAINVKLPGGVGALVNKPSDGIERPCSTYILLVTDSRSDGAPRRLAIKNDGAIILTGSAMTLDFTAVDSGFTTVAAPPDTFIASSGRGSVENGVYTAGMAGVDKLTLSSNSTFASGTAEIKVIDEPTSVYLRRPGQTARLTSVRLMPGESISLEAAATYYRREVTAQNNSFTFTVPDSIGTITPDGVFTAAMAPGASGVITVSAGATKADVNVELGSFTDMTGHWANDHVNRLATSGVVKGITETEYGPELNIKRGDFVLMLYRAAGQPAATEISEGFSDVAPDAYYSNAVLWAREAGIAQGMGDGKFSPDGTLTREQAFTFVYRALGILNVPYEDALPEDIMMFIDAADVAEYAAVPVAVLVRLSVVQGSDGYLTPKSSLTRAQMAKILSVVLQAANPVPDA